MQSGYPHSQGGGCPTFYQHWPSDALQSLQENGTASAPIFQPANGQNIPAIPNELKVASGPSKRQWDNVQSSQHDLEFQQENKLQAILGCYGHHNMIQIKAKGQHHKSTEEAFVYVSVQSHNFPTSGNDGRQQRKLIDSDLNNKEHQQKQLSNVFSLESFDSAMIQNNGLGVAVQTPEHMRLLESSPLLCHLLAKNPTNNAHLPTLTSLSKENNCSNCRHRTAQNPQCSGTQTRPHHQQDITSPVSFQRNLSAGKTDEQILDSIKEKIKAFKTQTYGHKKLNSNNKESLKSNIKPDTSIPLTIFNSEEAQDVDCAERGHHLSSLWLRHEGDSSLSSSANREFAAKSDVLDSWATSATEQHPTEIMQKVAGSLSKHEDKVPIVLTTFSGMTMDELAENHPGSTLNCNSSEEYKTRWLNTNSAWNNMDQVPGVSWSLMSEKKRGTVVKPDVGQFDCVEHPSMNPPFKSSISPASEVVSEYVEAGKMKNIVDQHQLIQHTGSKFESQADTIQIYDVKSLLPKQSDEHSSQKYLMGKQDMVYLGSVLLESKAEKQKPPPESKVEVFCETPQYEDISDEDQPHMNTQVAKTVHEGSNAFVGCRDPQYEDISEDDNSQTSNFDLEIQMAESKSVQSLLENERFQHKQSQGEMRAGNVSVEDKASELPDEVNKCSCAYYIDTEHSIDSMLCPKYESHLERQKVQPIRCSSLSDQKNENADGQNSDSESDDDFIVIPLTASNLKFELEGKIHKSKEIVVLSDDETSETECEGTQAGSCSVHYDLHHPASVPQVANYIPIYGTVESFIEKESLAVTSDVYKITSECEMSSRGSIPYPTEAEGSSETDDSCNYSSDPESNYLTVSKCLLVERSSSGPVEGDDSVSAAAASKANSDMNVHTSKTMTCYTSKVGPSVKSTTIQKLRQLFNTKSSPRRSRPKVNKRRILKQNDTTDSKSEDESSQNFKKGKKRFFSSRSDATNAQHHGHHPEVIHSQMYHAQFEEAMNDVSSSLTNTAEKTRHLVETNASNEHVPHKTNRCRISENERSDTEQDRRDPGCKKLKRKSSSSELGKPRKAQRHSHEPVHIQCKTGTEKVKKSIQSSGSLSHAHNKVFDAQLVDMMENTCSDQSNSGQRVEANVVFKHLPKTSEDKGYHLNSEPKKRLAESLNQLCEAGGKSSPENSTKKLQSSAKASESKFFSSSTVPDLVVKSRDHCDGFKLSDKDKTRTLKTTKLTKKNYSDTKKMKILNKSKRENFVSKPHLPKEKCHESENMDQASKAKQLSRQLSLPFQLPSTSENNYKPRNGLTCSPRHLSQDEEFSISSNQFTFEQNSSVPKQHFSRLQQSDDYFVSCHDGTTSNSVSLSTMQTSAKKKVITDWSKTYVPTRKDKKINLGAEEDTRSKKTPVKNISEKLYQESSKEAKPGPSHERDRKRKKPNDHQLMKKTKADSLKLMKERIQDSSTERSCNVGEGYKWKDKLPAAGLQKVRPIVFTNDCSIYVPLQLCIHEDEHLK